MKNAQAFSYKKSSHLLFSIISITFITAIFVCVLCDLIINAAFTWSLYTAGSCVLAWLTLLPLFKLQKHAVIASMSVFSVLVIPFLFLIEYICPVKNWVMPLGVPVAVVSIIYIWIAGFVLIKSKMRKWYSVSIVVLLSAPVSYIINQRVSEFLQESNYFSTVINVISIVCLSLALFFVGFATNRKDQRALK